MPTIYSTYEAKAKFSEILRQVRSGATVQVTYHGEPVAEIRPLERHQDPVEARMAELKARGELIPAADPEAPVEVGEPVPGGLERFLEDRNR